MKSALEEVFYPSTVEEWIGVNLDARMKKLEEVIVNAHSQLPLQARPKELL